VLIARAPSGESGLRGLLCADSPAQGVTCTEQQSQDVALLNLTPTVGLDYQGNGYQTSPIVSVDIEPGGGAYRAGRVSQ
jgi:hypothetical protein